MAPQNKTLVTLVAFYCLALSLGQESTDNKWNNSSDGVQVKAAPGDHTTPTSLSEMATIEEKDDQGNVLACSIWPLEEIQGYIARMEKEEETNLFKFTFKFENDSYTPFAHNIGHFYKPYLWHRTRSRHGRTLLMLSFHYDVLSMNILSIGVTDTTVFLRDGPVGCFDRLSADGKIAIIRNLLLSHNSAGSRSSYGSSAREEYVCNQVIKEVDGYAEFVHDCCTRGAHGEISCSDDDDDMWITFLYAAITLVKIMMFLYCPNFLPASMYSSIYMAAEYVIKLKKDLKMKMFISEQTDSNVRFKHRLTLEDVAEWRRFREALESFPLDEVIPIKMSELKIKVKGKRIIPENEPPTGLLRTIYDNLGRCKIKKLSAFRDCCESSVYASMEPKFRRKCTWHMFVLTLMKGILLFLIPTPFYLRLIIYYNYEHKEISMRREAMGKIGLTEKFDLYRSNVIQYFSPLHAIFIATYCFYFFAGLVIAFSHYSVREKLKNVARAALEDRSNVVQTGVLGVIVRTILFPYRKYGLLALLIAPFYIVLVLPLCILLFAVYCIPTIYLTHRLPFHARKLIGINSIPANEKRMKFKRMRKLGRRISKVDREVHKTTEGRKEESCCPGDFSFKGFVTVRDIVLQVACSVFCLCILYSIALIFAESTGLIIEVMAFTMMGIIVNAGNVLKYVTMVLLVFVYMHDCYDNVYENYLTFNKTIIDDMIERVTDDLRKIASMPSSMQANAAFLVKCVDEEKELSPTLSFDKKEIRWKLGQLLLFLDCFDTPRIPLRLFQKLCTVRVYGAPGPVYINLMAATGKFMIIVVFLMFVMLVVMAFGNVMAMSSTNTTLATMAGGFVPMLLKNVLSGKASKLNLKTISFKGQMDELISEYKQYWPVLDLIVERDIPEDNEDNNNDTDNIDGKISLGNVGSETLQDKGNEKTYKEKETKDDKKGKNDKKDKTKDIYVKVKEDDSIDWKNGDKHSESDYNKSMEDIFTVSDAPEEDENMIDLFVDLSVADTAGGWSIYGSSVESVRSEVIMPPYFRPDGQVPIFTAARDVTYDASDYV